MSYLEEQFNLKDKVTVVTGGLGMLGTEYVKALAQSGAKVAVVDIKTPDKNHELVGLQKQYPVQGYIADITSRAQVEKVLSEVVGTWGVPDVLINNAAIDFPPQSGEKIDFENYDLEEWHQVMDVNVTGMFICCQVIGGAMAQAGRGSIVNISSTYGLVGPDQRLYDNFIKPVSYSASKAGVVGLTKYLAAYWGAKNVRVNALVPGGVLNNQDEPFIKKYSERTPLGRMANKDEYNGAILFLASEASSYMTGSVLVIDGGWTAW